VEPFKTLGHPTRIHILELLSNLSQQLAVLRRTPLVVSQRNGSEVVYSVSVPELRDLLLAARRIPSGIIASRTELEAELRPTPQA